MTEQVTPRTEYSGSSAATSADDNNEPPNQSSCLTWGRSTRSECVGHVVVHWPHNRHSPVSISPSLIAPFGQSRVQRWHLMQSSCTWMRNKGKRDSNERRAPSGQSVRQNGRYTNTESRAKTAVMPIVSGVPPEAKRGLNGGAILQDRSPRNGNDQNVFVHSSLGRSK